MSRKDIIIISVLINAGLLAVLFVTALKTDSDTLTEIMKSSEPTVALLDKAENLTEIALIGTSRPNNSNIDIHVDEVDMVLKEYLPEIVDNGSTNQIFDPPPPPPQVKEEVATHQGAMVEVVVKSGDALEKIARANRTTIDAIRKANNLQNDKLKVGQVLKVPVGTIKTLEKKIVESKPTPETTAVYYVVKPGDNPWKIAKLHQVKFEDLLTLNNLDEERAKNLKVGEKIRVR